MFENKFPAKNVFLTSFIESYQKSYRDEYQLINFWAVFGHLVKVHRYKFLAGELIWKFGIMGWKLGSWILVDPVTGLLCKLA